MNEYSYASSLDVWAKLTDQEESLPFLAKVDKLLIPNYYKIITNPMDFDLIKRKLLAGNYVYDRDFEIDVRLIFANCHYFNAAWLPVCSCSFFFSFRLPPYSQ